MPTSLTRDRQLPATASDAFATWADRRFIEHRLGLVPEMEAQLTRLSVDAGGATIDVDGVLPPDWLPAMASAMLGPRTRIHRLEEWQRDGDGFAAQIAVQVSGAPVRCLGSARITTTGPRSSEIVFDLSISVNVPLLASSIETMVAGHLGPALDEEMVALDTELIERGLA